MAVALSGGVNVWGEFPATTVTDFIEGLVTFLLKAGWTLTDQIPASISHDFVGDAVVNNIGVSAGGLSYTWKTVINNANPREVLVNASKAISLANMVKAINTDLASIGTIFSNATTVNPLCVASSVGTILTITSRFEGPIGNGTASSLGSLANGGYRLTGNAPQKRADIPADALTVSTLVYDDQAAGATKRAKALLHSPADPTITTSARGVKVGAGVVYRVVANRCQFFCYRPGVAADDDGSIMSGGIPWIPANTSCDSEVTNGPVNEAFWGSADRNGLGTPNATPRTVIVGARHYTQLTALNSGQINNAAGWFGSDAAYNGIVTTAGNAIGQFRMVSMSPPSIDGTELISSIKWLGEKPLKLEPLVAWASITNTNQPTVRGQLYDAIIVTQQVPMDTVSTFDDHIWVALTDQSKFGTLWLIVPALTPETLDFIQAHYAF